MKDDAATEKQYDDLTGQVEVLKKQISANNTTKVSTAAELAVYESKKATIKEQINRCTVKSPLSGAIIEKYSEAGEITAAGKPLVKIADLGELWEERTQLPIPLGGIVVKRSLGYDVINKLNRVMYKSVRYAMEHPLEPMDYVRSHATEMQEEVMEKHIRLYVNEFTLDLGDEGKKAIQMLSDFIGPVY